MRNHYNNSISVISCNYDMHAEGQHFHLQNNTAKSLQL